MTVRELMKVLKKDSWYEVEQEGSHIQMKNKTKPGKEQYQTITEI